MPVGWIPENIVFDFVVGGGVGGEEEVLENRGEGVLRAREIWSAVWKGVLLDLTRGGGRIVCRNMRSILRW